MKKTTRLGLRLTDDERASVEAFSEASGFTMSELARLGLLALIVHAKRHGGRILIPLNYEETFTVRKTKKRRTK